MKNRLLNIQKLIIGFFQDVGNKKRFFLLFLVFGCIPTFLTVWVYYHHSRELVEQEISQSISKALAQTKSNLTFRMEMVAETASGMLNSIYPYIDRDPVSDSLGQQIEDFRTISGILSGYDKRNMIRFFRVYVPDSKLYARQRDVFFGVSELENTERLLSAFDMGKSIVWAQTHREGMQNDHFLSCICMTRKITEHDTFTAVLFADILEADLSPLLEINMNYGESVFLISEDGTILSHSDKSLLGTRIFSPEEVRVMKEKGRGLELVSDQELLAFESLEFTDWYLAAVVPRENIHGAANSSFGISILFSLSFIFLFLMFFMFVLYSLIVNSIVTKINGMNQIIREEGIPALEPIKEERKGLTALEKNIDAMIDTVHSLLEESYRDKLISREAQLKALQAQINPHFLYNTLDTIKWMILDEETEKSAYMVNCLSNYFRLSLSKGQDVVTLQNECELCRTYLRIQQIRFENLFCVEIRMDESAGNCLIPKLILQPVVENALLHGVKERGDSLGKICISVSLSDCLEIRVSDNGPGISETVLAALLHPQSGRGGYGLCNVQERIRLFCGKDYGIKVSSVLGEGTTVTLRMKIVQKSYPPEKD